MVRCSQQGRVRSPLIDLLAAAMLLVALAFAVRAFEPASIPHAREGIRVRVDHVHDGDSVWLKYDGEVHYFRLLGVDAPEVQNGARLREQAEQLKIEPLKLRRYGESAKVWLITRLQVQNELEVRFDRTHKDKYGRFLVHLFVPGQPRSINEELLHEGLAFRYRDQVNQGFQKEYDRAYREAREKRKGIWGLTPQKDTARTKGKAEGTPSQR